MKILKLYLRTCEGCPYIKEDKIKTPYNKVKVTIRRCSLTNTILLEENFKIKQPPTCTLEND